MSQPAGAGRLDVVSPLPPVRSGIADYTADLLPHLAELAEVRLARIPDQPEAPELTERWPRVDLDEVGDGGRLPLYQVGNNFYHAAIYERAMRVPGVVTLHDLVLHHLLIDRTLKDGDFDAYQEALTAEHGWIGAAAAGPRRWPGGWGDAAPFALPAHRQLLARQRGVIVHSRWSAEWLREEMPGLRVEAVAMGIPEAPRCDPEAGGEFRRRHGLPEAAPLLGSFGFQTPIKRTAAVIRTLARLDGVHLMVAGEVAPSLSFEELATAAGVAERVHVLGYLPFAELQAAIAAADLCLNLRYPTAGETSASLLRILAVGKAAVVSDHGQAAELPDEAVVKVPLGEHEEDVLAERLSALLADPDRLRAMGEAARRHVQEAHAPADAAAAIAGICRRFETARPLGEVPLPLPPTSNTWDRLDGTIEVAGAEPPWPEGERRRLEVRVVNRGVARWLAGERPAGGVALEVCWLGESGPGGRQLGGTGPGDGWLPLPFDLEPGAGHRFELQLRRPRGLSRLRIEPHVLGGSGFSRLGGPVWEGRI